MDNPLVRTRFAPSPTGYLHLGSLWMALFNWLYARHAGGRFIVRIEDTDRTRLVPEAERHIFATLQWYGLSYDEGPEVGGPYGPYRQSERLSLYRRYADELLASGQAYRCFCRPERLQRLRQTSLAKGKPPGYDGLCRRLESSAVESRLRTGEPFVIRLKFPRTGETTFTDLIRGVVSFHNNLVDDQVLVKSDGWPTYHLAAVVDDHSMAVNPVIRAEEWLPSTPKQIVLYQMLGWEAPQFAHLPHILNPDRGKLSKRRGSADALVFRREGYLPEAVLNYLALLGWNPKTSREIFSRRELIEQFDLSHGHKAGAVFDEQKLTWFNGQYLRRLASRDFIEAAQTYLTSERGYVYEAARGVYVAGDTVIAEDALRHALAALQTRLNRWADLDTTLAAFFSPPPYEAALLVWKDLPAGATGAAVTRQRLVWLVNLLDTLTPDEQLEESGLETAIKGALTREGLASGEVLWPMRVALSGMPQSPGPFTIAAVIGRAKTMERLRAAAAKLGAYSTSSMASAGGRDHDQVEEKSKQPPQKMSSEVTPAPLRAKRRKGTGRLRREVT